MQNATDKIEYSRQSRNNEKLKFGIILAFRFFTTNQERPNFWELLRNYNSSNLTRI